MKGTIWPRPFVKDPQTGACRPVKGSTWTFQFTVTQNGKRQNISKGGFPTKATCQEALTQRLAEYSQGTHVEPSKRTIEDYLQNEWLPLQKVSKKPSTYAGYVAIVKRVTPHLGATRLSDLTSGDIARLYSLLRDGSDREGGRAGLSAQSIKHTHSLLHSSLEHAVEAGLLPRNPARSIPRGARPRPRRAEMKTWTAEQVHAFFAVRTVTASTPATCSLPQADYGARNSLDSGGPTSIWTKAS